MGGGAVAIVMVVGLVFAGSSGTLPGGTTIDGVAVGGMTKAAAVALLESRAATVARTPVTFTAGDQRFAIKPGELGVSADWEAAVDTAAQRGDGISVLRGFRRLYLSATGNHLVAPVDSYDAAVSYEVGVLAATVDQPHHEAKLVRRGASFVAVAAQAGQTLDRTAAATVVVAALGGLSRANVALPVQSDAPTVTTADLAGQAALARRIVSAPVTLKLGTTRIQVSQAQLAAMLRLPSSPSGTPLIGGTAADTYFANLSHTVNQAPKSAGFAVSGAHVRLVPSVPGRTLDVPRTADSLLAAAERTQNRVATLAVGTVSGGRTTAQAKAMGITGLVSSYETFYGGIENRIHNVELVARLIDKHYIAPGATFSFNQATGERSVAKGFVEAPVIINGELETGLGGGVCQVSTTVFNAAFEGGLPITDRTNHALYIDHYPLGRDATVDYPDIDLKFVNDTGHWLLLRTFVGPSSLVVSLYGTPQHRKVVAQSTPLRTVSPMPVKHKTDLGLAPGEQEVAQYGQPATTTSVEREVYAPNGKLLSDSTWVSNYEALPQIVLIGPKKKHTPAKAKGKTATTTTSPG